MDEVKSIVFAGLRMGWAYNNILCQIKYAIAASDEIDILFICGDDSFPNITKKAEKLYKKYREEYYNAKT